MIFLLACLLAGVLGTAAPVRADTESLCRCLAGRTCLPPPKALIVCESDGDVQLYTRDSLLSKEVRVDELLLQLRNGSPAARTNAATDLSLLGTLQEPAVRALTRALTHDESKWVRRAAARSLGRLRLVNAVEALRVALKDRDVWVVHSAAEALRKITGERRAL